MRDSEGQKFSDADDQLTKLLSEIDDLLQRIQTTPIQKGSFQMADGISSPTTAEKTRPRTSLTDPGKGRQPRKRCPVVLSPISALQKQAMDVLVANRFVEARDAFRKSSEQLTTNKAQITDRALRGICGPLG